MEVEKTNAMRHRYLPSGVRVDSNACLCERRHLELEEKEELARGEHAGLLE